MTFRTPRLFTEKYLQVLLALATLILFGGHTVLVTAEQNNTKIALIGDQGTGQNAQAVLQLIVDEQADLLLIQGDLGYDDDAAAKWIENMDGILGPDFPVLLVVGNHENYEWPVYQQWLKDRISALPELNCQGEAGVKAYCTFENIGMVFVAAGIHTVDGVEPNDNYPEFISEQFATDNSNWKICSWHENMQEMQVGNKNDSTGWGVYEACREQGAIVATGHEHSYSRTHLMSSFENQQVVHTSSHMEIGNGQSFVFVNGLGGTYIRDQERSAPWWASVYSKSQNANHAALFCNLRDEDADCYLKDIAGLVPDSFTLENRSVSAATEAVTDQSVDTEPSTDSADTEPSTDSADIEPSTDSADSIVTVSVDSDSTAPGIVASLLTVQTDVVNGDESPIVGSALADAPEPVAMTKKSGGILDSITALLFFLLLVNRCVQQRISTAKPA